MSTRQKRTISCLISHTWLFLLEHVNQLTWMNLQSIFIVAIPNSEGMATIFAGFQCNLYNDLHIGSHCPFILLLYILPCEQTFPDLTVTADFLMPALPLWASCLSHPWLAMLWGTVFISLVPCSSIPSLALPGTRPLWSLALSLPSNWQLTKGVRGVIIVKVRINFAQQPYSL